MHDWYTAFGTSESIVPNVKHGHIDEPFPEAELTESVAHIEVIDHGDSPGEKFIAVYGTDEQRVQAAWVRVRNIVANQDWWK